MELTKEYFDKQFKGIKNRLDNIAMKDELKQEMAAIRSEMMTKHDLQTALKAQNEDLRKHTQSVGAAIVKKINDGFNKLDGRLEKILLARRK